MQRFDLLGPLPAHPSTTVLQASAGTGKTFALAGLVTRYLAEGAATLNQMLLITFSRAASQELRERVRHQIVDAVIAFDDPSTVGDNQLVKDLLNGTDDDLLERKRRLRDALAGFDAATIATNSRSTSTASPSGRHSSSTREELPVFRRPMQTADQFRRESRANNASNGIQESSRCLPSSLE